MKKIIAILIALTSGGITMAQSKTAVVYFSATGTTQAVARQIAGITGGDLLEIRPKEPYTAADLNWRDKNSRTTKEKDDRTIRPEIAEKIDVAAYDTIYLGFPIWWYEAPNIVCTFVESAGLSGKTVYTFFTSGGSGIGRTVQILQKMAPDADWKNARRFSGQVSESDITNW